MTDPLSVRPKKLRVELFARRPMFVIIAALLLVSVLAAALPGTFRLVLLQPARDLMFFQREVQPTRGMSDVQRLSPSPDETLVLTKSGVEASDIDITVDLWLPAVRPAPTVVLLHGSSPRGRLLGFNRLLADHLRAAGWLVVTPDARGFGDSRVAGDIHSPETWLVGRDLSRVFAFATSHPDSDGRVVAIGHSLGGAQLLDAAFDLPEPSAVVMIGPPRFRSDELPGIWHRIRFASDRRLARAMSAEVLADSYRRYDIMRLGNVRTERSANWPVLLMDGELEGEELIALLAQAASLIPPPVTHETVLGSHHYCGAYQLPWLNDPVFVRMEVFDRCFEVLRAFVETLPLAASIKQ